MTKDSRTDVIAPYAQTLDQTVLVRNHDDSTLRILATSAQTGGVAGVIEVTLPPGRGFPMHIHHLEDEAHFVLEGTLLFVAGDLRVEAGPGTFLFGPRGIAHGLKAVGDTPARFLESFLPAGLEELFSKPDEVMAAIEAGRTSPKYDLQVVGPMPE